MSASALQPHASIRVPTASATSGGPLDVATSGGNPDATTFGGPPDVQVACVQLHVGSVGTIFLFLAQLTNYMWHNSPTVEPHFCFVLHFWRLTGFLDVVKELLHDLSKTKQNKQKKNHILQDPFCRFLNNVQWTPQICTFSASFVLFNVQFQMIVFSRFCCVFLYNHEYSHCLNHWQTKDYITRHNKTERKL